MRVEGVIPTQEELQHMVAEVDQVNILLQNSEYEKCCGTKIRFRYDADPLELCTLALSNYIKNKNKKQI